MRQFFMCELSFFQSMKADEEKKYFLPNRMFLCVKLRDRKVLTVFRFSIFFKAEAEWVKIQKLKTEKFFWQNFFPPVFKS